jgi:16S rRNA (guanine527-N7)-methyltransferase
METYNVPHGTIDNYIDLLLNWNKKVNLVSVKDRDELIERHILDSLQLLNFIKKDEVVFDLGSGAGFPGLMLSYGGIESVNIVESNHKKASFLIVAASLSKNKVIIHNSKIEALNINLCDVITARGLASLEEIFASSKNIGNKKTKYFLQKGKNIESEIKKALDKWNFKYIIHQSKTSSEGCILEVEQLSLNEQKSYCSS